MLNGTLYRRELRGFFVMLAVFVGVLAMYMAMTIPMFDPKMQDQLNQVIEMMPGVMDAMGMRAGATTLIGFLSSYLYGFLLTLFPMVFTILCANRLIARYVDRGTMVSLLAAPVRRSAVALTQTAVLVSGIVVLIAFCTVMQLVQCAAQFPGELDVPAFLVLNAGLLCLHLFIGGVCFFCSCLFGDARRCMALGAGIPALAFLMQMLSNSGGKAEFAKYLTFFTLFNPDGLAAGEAGALTGAVVLLAGAAALFAAAIVMFSKKDLHI